MKAQWEVSHEKVRGGFYTPAPLVDTALDRLCAILGDRGSLRILEPSAGDGAFIRGIRRSLLHGRVESVAAVELLASEAASCQAAAREADLPAAILNEDFVEWQFSEPSLYDAAIGNPPFVRFQFVPETTKRHATNLASVLGLPVHRVSNLWIPVLLGALTKLRDGGAFAFVVPAESFTGISAGASRVWLMRHCEDVTFDLFPPRSFPGVLQEVVILSGRRRTASQAEGKLRVVDHESAKEWVHSVPACDDAWTRYLLEPKQLEALDQAKSVQQIWALGEVARFEVAAVTGANAYFSVDQSTLDEYSLGPWAIPLIPRIRHAQGLVYSEQDHQSTIKSGAKAWLLHFSKDRPNPRRYTGARRYIQSGEDRGLHLRYKTRIRKPWYRVPHVRSEPLMLSKRSHRFPRVVLNEAGAVTTDTIYRGVLRDVPVTARDFVAGFHNSLTLLTAETEGRSFGGGVLELVPSEIGRLLVPVIPGFGAELERLDAVAGDCSESDEVDDPLIAETNGFLVKAGIGIDTDLVDHAEAGRRRLVARRLGRSE